MRIYSRKKPQRFVGTRARSNESPGRNASRSRRGYLPPIQGGHAWSTFFLGLRFACRQATNSRASGAKTFRSVLQEREHLRLPRRGRRMNMRTATPRVQYLLPRIVLQRVTHVPGLQCHPCPRFVPMPVCPERAGAQHADSQPEGAVTCLSTPKVQAHSMRAASPRVRSPAFLPRRGRRK